MENIVYKYVIVIKNNVQKKNFSKNIRQKFPFLIEVILSEIHAVHCSENQRFKEKGENLMKHPQLIITDNSWII